LLPQSETFSKRQKLVTLSNLPSLQKRAMASASDEKKTKKTKSAKSAKPIGVDDINWVETAKFADTSIQAATAPPPLVPITPRFNLLVAYTRVGTTKRRIDTIPVRFVDKTTDLDISIKSKIGAWTAVECWFVDTRRNRESETTIEVGRCIEPGCKCTSQSLPMSWTDAFKSTQHYCRCHADAARDEYTAASL
jgi:hypothetical protein